MAARNVNPRRRISLYPRGLERRGGTRNQRPGGTTKSWQTRKGPAIVSSILNIVSVQSARNLLAGGDLQGGKLTVLTRRNRQAVLLQFPPSNATRCRKTTYFRYRLLPSPPPLPRSHNLTLLDNPLLTSSMGTDLRHRRPLPLL